MLGPPGIGKTRLAQELLARHEGRFAVHGGAWFCDLSEARDDGELASALLALWSVRGGAPVDADDALHRLEERVASSGPMLLVLDNFEQLVQHAWVVRDLCSAAPELRVVTTSRERLAVEGEVVIELGPLSCPGENDEDDACLASDAVRFLALRAEAVGGKGWSAPATLGALARRVDGIPLALELAAARARVLSPVDVLARLDASFHLLKRGSREVQGRHATLASSIDGSWKLLSAPEQRSLAELSVFAGGFALEAAEAVLSAPDALDHIGALREKSLVHVEGGGRLALYASIREYAAARLASLGREVALAARHRHARHLARALRPLIDQELCLTAPPDPALRARLAAERDNALAALAFVRPRSAISPDAARTFAELALGVALLDAVASDVLAETLAAALAALPQGDARLRACLLVASRAALNGGGRGEEALRNIELALGLEGAPPRLRAHASILRGCQLRYLSHYRASLDFHRAAALDVDHLGTPMLAAMNWACMGRLAADLRDEAAAREWNGRARAEAAATRDLLTEGMALANLAQLEQELGRLTDAADLLSLAMARFRATSESQYASLYSATMGDLSFERGLVDDARRSYRAASRALRGWDAHRGAALCHAAWGALEATHGARDEAEALFARARQSARRGDTPTVRVALELHEASLRLRAARDANDPERMAREESTWRERARALRDGDAPDAEHAACSLEVRFALRILERALGACRAAESLTLARDGSWMTVGASAAVDLRRRASLRRIVLALAEAHGEHPGRAVEHDALVERGWPGERMLRDAAGTRLRVAIATLRRLGLRDVVVTHDDGYSLDRAVRVRFVD